MFHIPHDLTFEAEYQRFCHGPNTGMSKSLLALLFANLAIAISALDEDDPLLSDLGRERTVGRNVKVRSTRYRSAALRCLASDMIEPPLHQLPPGTGLNQLRPPAPRPPPPGDYQDPPTILPFPWAATSTQSDSRSALLTVKSAAAFGPGS